MKEHEIKECNKLIAKFMHLTENNNGLSYFVETQGWTSPLNLLYDTSWDLLMPVVEKIESLGFDSRIHGNNSDDGYLCDFVQADTNNEISCCVTWQDVGGTKIEATFKTVVQFIKWYNENK